MPVRKMPLVIGETYHIYNRGINKKNIFLDKRDCSYWLKIVEYHLYQNSTLSYSRFRKLAKYKRELLFEKIKKDNKKFVELLAFCVMPNHFHLVIKQVQDAGIITFLRKIQNSYASFFNIKYKRSGPLFEGRFKSIHIKDDEELIQVVRYIHLNPVTAHLISSQDLKNYKWTSLPNYLKNDSDFCDINMVLDHFPSSSNYLSHVLDQADYQQQLAKLKNMRIEE